ncbi:MAG: long-chain fatty acid--CoA ligase [Planctomycetales bacterium]|nr:long-chain fatty acid--CoA ligase [Planctomycetales bacterium]
MGLNLATLLTEAAREWPDRPAIVCGSAGLTASGPERLTYRELALRAGRFAGLLGERGVRPGDRVAVQLPNVTAFPIAYFGSLMAGAVVVPLNPLLKRDEIAYHLADSGARVFVSFAAFRAEAEAGAAAAGVRDPIWSGAPGGIEARVAAGPAVPSPFPAGAGADAVLIYTSGTTGRPKGARLTHGNLFLNAWVSRELADLGPEDRCLGALPFFHSFGQTCVMNAGILGGATLVLMPRFEPEPALALLASERVTIFAGVPTMYHYLLESPSAATFDARGLRLCISGGAALPGELLRRFEQRFGGMILEGYGLSEASPTVTFNRRDRPRKVGSIGLPVWGVEVRVVKDDGGDAAPGEPGEPGEIWVRGHNVMAGYWNRPEESAETLKDGWLRTGDIATRDSEGYLFIVDRKKELIIRGGYNVYPREVEEVLVKHPAVAEAAVVGVPHEALGEEVAAFVSLRRGARATAEEIVAFAKERVAAYKYPRSVEILESLPKGPTGKILKRALKA